MIIKKSNPVNIQANGTWDNAQGKTFYKYEIEMANGDMGEYSSISDQQNKFTKGLECEYEFHEGKFPKIKPHSEFKQMVNSQAPIQNNTMSKQDWAEKDQHKEKMISRQVALKCAIEFTTAYIRQGENMDPSTVIEVAEVLNAWILNNPVQDKPNLKNNDDLPF